MEVNHPLSSWMKLSQFSLIPQQVYWFCEHCYQEIGIAELLVSSSDNSEKNLRIFLIEPLRQTT
jgi:hypothetical protein